MNAKLAWGIAACTLWPFLTGCGSSPGIVRGQNPAELAAFTALPGQTVSHSHLGGHGCPGCCSAAGQHNLLAMPKHHVFSHGNNQPKDLVYPPANQPGAVVQYPYYTVKGPTDFFME